MNIGKICYYLYDIGLIQSESIDDFLELHKKINKDKSLNNSEGIKLTLSAYLSQKLNSKQNMKQLSSNIVDSFSKQMLINRYSSIRLLYSILFSIIRSRYIMFFTKLNFFIFNKNINDSNIKEIKKGRIKKNNKKNNKEKNINDVKENNEENKEENDNIIDNNKNIQLNENINNEKKIELDNNVDDLNQQPPSLHYNYYLLIKEEEKNKEKIINNKNNSNVKYLNSDKKEELNDNSSSSKENEKIEDKIIKDIKKNLSKTNSYKTLKTYINKYYGYKPNTNEFLQKEEEYKKNLEDKIINLYNQEIDRMLARVTFFPQSNPYSFELIKKKYSEEKSNKKNKREKLVKNNLNEYSPEQKKIYFNLLEKNNLKKIQDKNKEEKIKKERREKKMKNLINENIKTIKKNFNENELIERLYKTSSKVKPKEEKKKLKKEIKIKSKEKEENKQKENNIEFKIKKDEKSKENKEVELKITDNPNSYKKEEDIKKENNVINNNIKNHKEEKENKEKEHLKGDDDALKESKLSVSSYLEKIQNEYNNAKLLDGKSQSKDLAKLLNKK